MSPKNVPAGAPILDEDYLGQRDADTHYVRTAEAATQALITAAKNSADVEALKEWQRQQNGTLKDIKAELSAMRVEVRTSYENGRNERRSDLASFRTEQKTEITQLRQDAATMYRWIIAVLISILLLLGGPLLVHVLTTAIP